MKTNSIVCAVHLAQAFSLDVLPLDNRSDHWWDEFWRCMGLQEAQLINDRQRDKAKEE